MQYTSLQKFCCSECRINEQKSRRGYNHTEATCKARTGKNNPSYRNGNYTRKRKKTNEGHRKFQKNAKEIKESLIAVFGHIKCQHCETSTSSRFETHHIIFRSEMPNHENLHDKSNLIVLCIKCHNEFHKHKMKRDGIVIERGLHYQFGNSVLSKDYLRSLL
jgi:5-methylcytosine-specific restriction endonuclease McrA